MPDTPKMSVLVKNRLLAALPPAEYGLLKPLLKPVSFASGDILFHAGDPIRRVYFPNNGMISLLSVTHSGQTVEVGFTGEEGVVGLPLLLGRDEMPYQAMAQTPSEGFSVEAADIIGQFRRGGALHDVLLRYVFALIKQLMQTGLCHNFHNIEARLCRWLMIMLERSDTDYLTLTQEFIAHMLGVQRTSVAMIAGTLQAEGIIRYSRGRIEIIDREKLAATACECYLIVKDEFDNFLKR